MSFKMINENASLVRLLLSYMCDDHGISCRYCNSWIGSGRTEGGNYGDGCSLYGIHCRKFICINDNIDHDREGADVVRIFS